MAGPMFCASANAWLPREESLKQRHSSVVAEPGATWNCHNQGLGVGGLDITPMKKRTKNGDEDDAAVQADDSDGEALEGGGQGVVGVRGKLETGCKKTGKSTTSPKQPATDPGVYAKEIAGIADAISVHPVQGKSSAQAQWYTKDSF